MVQMTKTMTISREAVEQVSKGRSEPEWLLKLRLEAWRLFEEAPMPDPLSEDWKRFDTESLTLDGLAVVGPERRAIEGAAGLPAELRSLWDEREELAGRIVQVDSDVVYRQVDAALAERGVIVTDLHTAAREHEPLVRERLMSLVTAAEWKYLALHGALWSGGAFLYVPAGVEVELPIEYGVGVMTPELATFPHLLIVAEANSSVTVIQEGLSDGTERNAVSGAVEVFADEGSRVRLVEVQRHGGGVQGFSTARARLSRGASFDAIVAGLGGATTRERLDVTMPEEGAEARLSGLFLGDAQQRFYYDTLQEHIAPKTISDLLFKAALTDRAGIIWNGVVDLKKSASQAEANQTSRNLLLSDTASASPTPILEISAHDVTKCSHGATVGPVDREQLFYLQSRGIPEEEAERMLIDGFFAEVLERVPSERLRERIGRVLQQKLGR
jgi:Fe-S cluster assembly protein SufD